MNILRNIATAALQSTGVTFPFQIGDRISLGPTNTASFDNQVIWDIRSGIKKDDGTPLTLFVFDVTAQQPGGKDRKAQFQLAKNALKKLRTIRHPNILKYIDSVETETHIYIATERVTPLSAVLQQWEEGKILKGDTASRKKGQEEWIAWGLKDIGTALAFLNAPPLSQHHTLLLPTSIYITPALEWRLAGFEVLSGKDDPQGVAWAAGLGVGVAPGGVGERIAPEVKKAGWAVLRDSDPGVTDAYLFALLIHTIYNPLQSLPNLSSAPTQSSAGTIPRSLFPIFKRMLNPNPRMRLSTTSFISELEQIGFWQGNNLVELVSSLEAFELASEGQKAALLRRIKDSIATLPPPFLISKILPSLLHSLSLPSAPSSAILPLVLAIGRDVPEERYKELVLEPVVRLYVSPDRGTRMALLDGLVEYGERLDKSMVNDKVWPHLITGFADTVAVIREATVKAIPIIAPKLSDRLLNNDLLRLLAKMQVDPEPSIRTNTCILLGRLAPFLGTNTKKKVLVAAFARSLKDSFVHARVAGLMALMATVEYYDKEDLAGKVVPNMSFTLVDREKLVRDQAFKAMQMFMSKLEAAAEAMPDTVIPENASNGQTYGPSTTTMLNGSHSAAAGSSLVNSATGAAGALAGWAIASLGKQLPVSEAHSSIAVTPAQVQEPLSVQRTPSDIFQSASMPLEQSSAGPSRSNTPSQASRLAPARKAGGMQLGGAGVGARAGAGKTGLSSSWMDELSGEFEQDEVADAWGSGDLMDVNADGDDWSAFEEAPVPLESEPRQSSSEPRRSQSSHRANTRAIPDDPWSDPVPALPNLSIAKPKQPTSFPAKLSRSKQAPPAATPPVVSSPSNAANEWTAAKDSEWQDGGSQAGTDDKPAAPVNVSLAGMSKEEKEKEMARRREERKARIAAMKNKT